MNISPFFKRINFFIHNKEIYSNYREIKRENKIYDKYLNLNKYNKIKKYAIEHTVFYKNYSIEDEFPVMSKIDLINNSEIIQSNEIFQKDIHYTSTSGSTGVPFIVKQNRQKRLRTIADLKVFGEYADYKSHEKMLQLRAYKGNKLDKEKDRKDNIYRFDITDLSEVGLNELFDDIKKIKPKIIFGYVSTLNILSKYIHTNFPNEEFPYLKSILVGAEALTPEIANQIEKVFGCNVFDRYSNMEMGIYAQRKYGELFKFNHSSYYLEILKLDSDLLADEGEIGRIVITDLYNKAFPMIRYDTGDLGTFKLIDDEIFLDKIFGRRVDIIYSPDNNIIDPHVISKGLWGLNNVKQWQFIQKNRSLYTVKIVSTGIVDENLIILRLKEILGNSAVIQVDYIDEIPVLNSQKRKYILNEWIAKN
ncbi:MAG: hypothetical protein E6X95_12125 [Thomasclavelia ramosa]|nr:hypothetical protein [Thomasclavelia ramosa]